jgi:hypothetical protein
MTLHPTPSEFPYIRGHFFFFFYQREMDDSVVGEHAKSRGAQRFQNLLVFLIVTKLLEKLLHRITYVTYRLHYSHHFSESHICQLES